VDFYAYETTFDLSVYVLSTVALAGIFTADNWIVDVLLNGQSTGISYTTALNDGQLYTPFSPVWGLPTTSNWLQGVNSLVFVTRNIAPSNNSNPTGLRVEFLASSGGAVIPEPASALLFVLGAPVVGIFVRRRTV
jgi:hypothetical protein